LAGPRQPPRQRPSQRWAVATVLLPILSRIFFGNARHDFSWHTSAGGTHRPRAGLLGRRIRRLMHIDSYSLDRSGRFRRESTAISHLCPKETWLWTSISKPSW